MTISISDLISMKLTVFPFVFVKYAFFLAKTPLV